MAHLLSGGFDGPSYGDSGGRGKERQATLCRGFSEVLHDFLDPADALVRAPCVHLCRVGLTVACAVVLETKPPEGALELAAGAAVNLMARRADEHFRLMQPAAQIARPAMHHACTAALLPSDP
jgi:hypothetical protein